MVGDSIAEALTERSQGVLKELSTFLLLKQDNLNELYTSEQIFLGTTQNLAILQIYCQDHLVALDQNQQEALAGLVAYNLHAKLEALREIKTSLLPIIHAQMNASFREAVCQKYSAIDPSDAANSMCLFAAPFSEEYVS